jgi:predicted anti-sigma-YlaC factor YlaD
MFEGNSQGVRSAFSQTRRLIAVFEAVALFVAAAAYVVVGLLTAFMLMLGAYHWTTLTIIGLCGAGALASVVLAVTLLANPSRTLMIAGALLIVIGGGLVAYLKARVGA